MFIIEKNPQKDIKDNNIERILQQSADEENADISSYCNSTYWQTSEHQNSQ